MATQQGTGFVNFQDMLNANRQYPQQVIDERERASQFVDDTTSQFNQYEQDLRTQLAAGGHQLRSEGLAPVPDGMSISNLDQYAGYGNIPSSLTGFDTSVQSNPRPWQTDYRDIDIDPIAQQQGARDLYGSLPGVESFGTDVKRAGTVGEKTLDSAIYGDMYGTQDETYSGFKSGLEGGGFKDQFADEDTGLYNMNRYIEMLRNTGRDTTIPGF